MCLLRKTLRKKVVIAIAIPFTRQQFDTFFDRGDSDFIRSLTERFKTKDKETLWGCYSKIALSVKNNLQSYAKRGVVVIEELTTIQLQRIADADIAIVIAHHSDLKDEMEMSDGMVSTSNFVEAVPIEFKGMLDLSSCYSSSIQLSIKMRCPNSHVLAVKNKIPLQQRMTVYDYVIKTMCQQPKMEYLEIIKSAYAIILQMQRGGNVPVNPDIVYLGGSIQSSVFAPKQVEKGQPFLIQVAIHKSKEADAVEIMAREVDGSASLRNPLRLSFKLKKKDMVDIALKIDSAQKDDFKIKRARDSFYWENEPRFINFTVFVSEQCKSKSCLSTIKICVNKLPVGDITFNSEVVDTASQNNTAAEINFQNYNKPKEMSDAKSFLLFQLKKELEALVNGNTNRDGSLPSQRDIDICKNSIKLLEDIDSYQKQNQVFRVFISSTSDLSSFRNVMERRVLDCSMYPEMYEKWPQKDKYPRDYCIEKVLLSDIFVCILGPNYGYIEPTMDASMTEIEFRVALLSGKPILVYVMENYEDKMLAFLPEHQHEVNKQRDLINELDKKRMVEFFKDENGLALLSTRELTILQTELQNERTEKR